MEPLRLEPVPARIVAWHNRHPLASRITPEQVGSMGYVALPFVQPAGGRLRRGFDEDFLDGVSVARIARWAARHGAPAPEAPDDGPLRAVMIERSRFAPDDKLLLLYVRTAFIDDGWRQSRVLVGAGPAMAVLGPRLWSRPRLAIAGGTLAALGGLALAVMPRSAPVAEQQVQPLQVAEAASAAASGAAAPAAAAASAVAAAASRPADVNPQWGRIDLPRIRPDLAPAGERVARPKLAPEAATAEAAASAAPAAAPTRHAAAPAPAAAPAAPLPPGVWALSSRPFRNETETEQVSVATAALFQRAGLRSVRVQALEVKGAWHVVSLPFPSRDAAENARHLLATRGLQTEPVEF